MEWQDQNIRFPSSNQVPEPAVALPGSHRAANSIPRDLVGEMDGSGETFSPLNASTPSTTNRIPGSSVTSMPEVDNNNQYSINPGHQYAIDPYNQPAIDPYNLTAPRRPSEIDPYQLHHNDYAPLQNMTASRNSGLINRIVSNQNHPQMRGYGENVGIQGAHGHDIVPNTMQAPQFGRFYTPTWNRDRLRSGASSFQHPTLDTPRQSHYTSLSRFHPYEFDTSTGISEQSSPDATTSGYDGQFSSDGRYGQSGEQVPLVPGRNISMSAVPSPLNSTTHFPAETTRSRVGESKIEQETLTIPDSTTRPSLELRPKSTAANTVRELKYKSPYEARMHLHRYIPMAIEDDDVENVKANEEEWVWKLKDALQHKQHLSPPTHKKAGKALTAGENLRWNEWQQARADDMSIYSAMDIFDEESEIHAWDIYGHILSVHEIGYDKTTPKADVRSKCSQRLEIARRVIQGYAIVKTAIFERMKVEEFAANPQDFIDRKINNLWVNYGKKAKLADGNGDEQKRAGRKRKETIDPTSSMIYKKRFTSSERRKMKAADKIPTEQANRTKNPRHMSNETERAGSNDQSEDDSSGEHDAPFEWDDEYQHGADDSSFENDNTGSKRKRAP